MQTSSPGWQDTNADYDCREIKAKKSREAHHAHTFRGHKCYSQSLSLAHRVWRTCSCPGPRFNGEPTSSGLRTLGNRCGFPIRLLRDRIYWTAFLNNVVGWTTSPSHAPRGAPTSREKLTLVLRGRVYPY